MRLRSDTSAASPLVVIATFVLGAILLTALAYALLVDRPEDRLELVEDQRDGTAGFTVTRTAGGLRWDGVTVRFLDRAGTDQVEQFLQVPDGDVDEGDRLVLQPPPPAGTYVLLVLHDGSELARLRVDV